MFKRFIFIAAGLLLSLAAMSQREIVTLSGRWDIEESIGAEKAPSKFSHQVQVPGLVNTASPGFNGVDDINVRFIMREFRFDTPTKRAYLNDKLIFLRGFNITLHRFFDDSLCLNHPWDEQWVRKLLPKKSGSHWFYTCAIKSNSTKTLCRRKIKVV